MDWTGSIQTCNAGTVNPDFQEGTIWTVNYARALAGLNPLVEDTSVSAKAQQAALMMSANYKLSHFPTSDWLCYTSDGASAAGALIPGASSADLYLGSTGPNAMLGYLTDYGQSNRARLGHRKSLLTAGATGIGTGSTYSANSTVIMGLAGQTGPSNYVAWPSSGYFPQSLRPFVYRYDYNASTYNTEAWSIISIDTTIDVSQASVTVTNDGNAIPVTVKQLSSYGGGTMLNGLSWDINTGYQPSMGDRSYVVTVSGIIKNSIPQPDYIYTVKYFDENIGPSGTVYRFWSEQNRHHFLTADPVEARAVMDNYTSWEWSFEGPSFTVYPVASCPVDASPIYRFWSEQNRSHFYTIDEGEKNYILSAFAPSQWKLEGAVYCAYKTQKAGSIPLYRFWSEQNRGHFYTIDEGEKNYVINSFSDFEWRYENIAYYVLPS